MFHIVVLSTFYFGHSPTHEQAHVAQFSFLRCPRIAPHCMLPQSYLPFAYRRIIILLLCSVRASLKALHPFMSKLIWCKAFRLWHLSTRSAFRRSRRSEIPGHLCTHTWIRCCICRICRCHTSYEALKWYIPVLWKSQVPEVRPVQT